MIKDSDKWSVASGQKISNKNARRKMQDKRLATCNLKLTTFILILTVCGSLFTVVTACSKKTEEAKEEDVIVGAGNKKSDVTVSAETIPTEFANAYKNVVVVSEVEGIDWQKGTITAIGRGYPPKDITNPAQIRILTMRAAKIEGYKVLLETILKMKTPPDRGMKEYLDEKRIEISRIEGFLKGARVVKEEYKDDGSAEVTLEVPLTGADGLVTMLK